MSIERALQLAKDIQDLSKAERNVVLACLEALKTKPDGPKPQKRRQPTKIRRVIFPDGHTEDVEQMHTFCLTHGLNESCMSQMLTGRLDEHRGFRAIYVDPAFEPVHERK
jgi:hypothetical protein